VKTKEDMNVYTCIYYVFRDNRCIKFNNLNHSQDLFHIVEN